jgi:transcriptional regulator with XRE-family HTH domain
MKIKREELRRERLRRALSMRGLAEKAGISYVTLSRIENGSGEDVRPTTLRKISDALGIEPDILIDWRAEGLGDDDSETGKAAA